MTRIAGIDFGTVRIGVAIADTEVGIASPLATHTRQTAELDARYFRRLVDDEAITKFVVGLPVHLDGRESQKSREARAFGEWLHTETGVAVEYFDERFTTCQADELLAIVELTSKKRKARRDQLAAQIMLAAYLESSGKSQESLEGIE
jgi:putative Holliday junction resolvase